MQVEKYYSITIFPKRKQYGHEYKRTYKRINNARKIAQALALNNYSIMIRENEICSAYESSAPFEEYEDGKRIRCHADFLTEYGKKVYGYV